MGPRYLPSPESIVTIPNANLEMSIDRVLGGRDNWEQYNTEEFKSVIRQRVQKFVKGMQTSILNICLLWKQVLARKAKSNIGSIEILNPDNPESARKMALTNLMVRISSGSDFSWGTEFGYLGQLAQREPPGQVYFARNMGFNSPPDTNLSHKVFIYRFFFESCRDIVDSFQQVQLPDNSAGAKQQAN